MSLEKVQEDIRQTILKCIEIMDRNDDEALMGRFILLQRRLEKNDTLAAVEIALLSRIEYLKEKGEL